MNIQQEARTISRFLSVGVLNTLIDFGVFNLLLWLGTNNYVAASLSFLAATTNSYIWNRSWTFSHTKRRAVIPQFSLFLLSNLVGLGINNAVQYYAAQQLEPTPLILNIAKLVSIVLVVLWNYASSRLIVFQDQ